MSRTKRATANETGAALPSEAELAELSPEALLEALVDELVVAAAGRPLPLSRVDLALDQLGSMSELDEVPDIAVLLSELANRGIEVDDEVEESELSAAATTMARVLTSSDEGDLDALAQWQRDSLRHPVLSRAEESELTTRYALYARTARALEAAIGRLEKDILGPARAELAAAEELADLVADDDGSVHAEVRDRLAAAKKAVRAGEKERDALQVEIDRAHETAREAEGVFLSYNYRLVFYVANRKFQQAGRKGEILDLVQQGNVGMIDALRKFDPGRGYKFSTFATWHIQQAISMWLYEQVGSLRVPTHRWRDARRINRFRHEFTESNGRAPNDEEIGEALGKTARKIREILAAEQLTRTPSLDRPISAEDGSATLGDLVADTRALDPELAAVRDALRTTFNSAFERVLDGRERRVLMLRFGLEDDTTRTLDWIGRRMNITRERVRQIEERALKRLRSDDEIAQMAWLEGRELEELESLASVATA